MQRSEEKHRNLQINNVIYAAILFSFPLDFIRLYWVLTFFDLIAILSIPVVFFLDGQKKYIIKYAIQVFSLYALLILLSVIVNIGYLEEHLVLIAGTALSILKAAVILQVIRLRGGNFWFPICLGILCVNILLIIWLLLGEGFTNSGRFRGFFPQSNGMATFQTFAIAVSLFGITLRIQPVAMATLVLSTMLLLLTGSRGGLVCAAVLFAFVWVRSLFFLRGAHRVFIIVFVKAVILIGIIWFFDEIFNLIQNSDFAGLRRIGQFVDDIIDGNLMDVFNQSRGVLNSTAIEYFLNNPRLFGSGYESSAYTIGSGQRVHNIFLVSLVELGVLCFLFFLVVMGNAAMKSLRFVFSFDEKYFFTLMFVPLFFAANKTPYYFLNAVSWMVIIYFLIPKRLKFPNGAT